jgi:hypothetical protein
MRTEQPKQHMSGTYKAVQATQPGKLQVVERSIAEPAFGAAAVPSLSPIMPKRPSYASNVVLGGFKQMREDGIR